MCDQVENPARHGGMRLRLCSLLAIMICAPAGFAAQQAAAKSPCAARENIAQNSDVAWAELRDACEAEQVAYKEKHPVDFAWFANAANGFSGFPYILQRILPDLAPEIWGRPEENFARFGYFPDPDPRRPLPRGLGIASTAGRPFDGNNNTDPVGEIDFAKPGLHVVTLSCGACHSGQVRTDTAIKVIEGAPNTRMDVRKWRDAYNRTVHDHLSDFDKIKITSRRIAEIIDSKGDKYFYPTDYFSGPGFQNFTPAVDKAQRDLVKANLVGLLSIFACLTSERKVGQDMQLETSYGKWNSPGLAGFSTGQQDGSGDLVFQLLVANAVSRLEMNPNRSPECIRIPLATSPDHYASLGHARAIVYPGARTVRDSVPPPQNN